MKNDNRNLYWMDIQTRNVFESGSGNEGNNN